jgi:excisionase family DNA binding protein
MTQKLTEILTNTSKRASETESAPMAPLALGVPQAAEASGLSTRYLWDEIKAKRLKAIKKGRRVLVPVDALKKFLNVE